MFLSTATFEDVTGADSANKYGSAACTAVEFSFMCKHRVSLRNTITPILLNVSLGNSELFYIVLHSSLDPGRSKKSWESQETDLLALLELVR